MEVDSKGDSDSELSDSWSVVDIKPNHFLETLSSSDSGVLTSHSSKEVLEPSPSVINLDECFELTELSLANEYEDVAPNDKIIHFERVPSNEKHPLLDHCKESDIDTDGISVISEDEEYIAWKENTHSNFEKSMQHIDSTPETSKEEVEEPAILAETVEDMCEVTNEMIVDNENHLWTQYLTGHFFTGAIFAALACIAISHLFQAEPTTKDKVTEILEVMEHLKAENDALRFQLQDLTVAYNKLQSKLIPAVPVSQELPSIKQEGPLPASQITYLEELLQKLATQQPHLQDLTAKIESLCAHIPQVQASDFQNLNNRVYNVVQKMLKQTEDGLEKRLNDLAIRLEHKIKHRLKRTEEDLNIVQWFPDETVVSDVSEPNEEGRTVQNIGGNPQTRATTDQIISLPKNVEPEMPKSESELPLQRKKVKKRKLMSETESNTKRTAKKYEKKEKCNKCSREKYQANDLKKTTKPKTFKTSHKVAGENGTAQWLFERSKRREWTRDKEQEGEWQFDRARGRFEARKGVKDRAQWYFKRYDLHASDKKGFWSNSDNFVFST